MFAQWWRDVLVQSVIFVQRLVTWDKYVFKAHHCANTNVGGHFNEDEIQENTSTDFNCRTNFM